MDLHFRQITIKTNEVYKIAKVEFGKYEYTIGVCIFPLAYVRGVIDK